MVQRWNSLMLPLESSPAALDVPSGIKASPELCLANSRPPEMTVSPSNLDLKQSKRPQKFSAVRLRVRGDLCARVKVPFQRFPREHSLS